MEPSAILRQQSNNKIHNDFQRMKNEQNKKPADPKQSKLVSVPLTSNKDAENQHPEISEIGRKAPVRQGQGGSRLPVLAKSLHLQTASNFSQSHSKWEENPLAGKAKKKRPCTRPVPFNFSQPRSSRVATVKQPQTVMQTGTKTPQRNMCNANSASQPTVLNNKKENVLSHPSAQTGPPSNFKTSHTLSNSGSMTHQNKSVFSTKPVVISEFCLDNMNQLSIKEPSEASNVDPTSQQQGDSLKDKQENFQSDHKALLSILCNKGVDVTSATPQSKQYNYLPQRVSIMKSRKKTGPTTASVKSVQFSPDPSALQSILLNEGVKAGQPLGATPRNSTCPPGRGTSIYTAQRVLVKKNRMEPSDGPAVALRVTPQSKWTPQRVSRHRPMSALKWHQSTQPLTYTTPGAKNCKGYFQSQQQEVVQRLFVDAEEEQNPDPKDPDTCAQQLPVTASVCEDTERQSRISSDEEGDKPKVEDAQPFLQAPDRESVIFFSTGKKLFRAPRFEKPDEGGPPSSSFKLLQLDEFSAKSAGINQINLSERPHREPVAVKPCSLSPAVALLRRRLPPLDELRMDQEVATYTSMSVTALGFVRVRSRCGNPLASILHFEDSIKFVPIHFDTSSGPYSPLHD
ncbi:uncharacterized protein troap isoform X2 [Gouania willdenowi]|uniref:uncharacterized protein troap isoform X2 n=1 Tax=Gouania willdenowi TaxID=441366 RepID=UPI0010566855|nr:uncharacterized protein LOC114467059 isoform X2 [Gouania willdenowi]